MKKILIAVIVIILIVVGYNFLKKDTNTNEPITIGYIGPLTGPSAVLGMDAVKAIEIAVIEANANGGINGRQIRVIFEDDQYLTKNTVSSYDKLVHTDNASVILVATYGGLFAVKDKAAADNVVVINPLDCNKDVADAEANIFCIATETESIGEVLADQMIKEGKLSAGIMYSTKDAFMALVSNAFKARFESKGGKVNIQSFNYEDKDFRTQLLKLREAKVEGLVLLGHDETGIIMKQSKDLGMKLPFYTTGTITSPVAQELAANNAEGTVFAYWDADIQNEKAKAFAAKFKKAVGRDPILPLTTHPAYDTMTILIEEVLTEGTDADDIKEALLDVSGYQGITGTIMINASGAAPIKESVFKLMNGIPVKI